MVFGVLVRDFLRFCRGFSKRERDFWRDSLRFFAAFRRENVIFSFSAHDLQRLFGGVSRVAGGFSAVSEIFLHDFWRFFRGFEPRSVTFEDFYDFLMYDFYSRDHVF